MATTLTTTIQACSITAAIAGAGGMATLSFLDIPELQSQPADRSLPVLRWLFSRGSYIFPQAGEIATLGFLYLAYDSLPAHLRTASQLFRTTNGNKFNGYIVAAALGISIIPFTRFVMVPNNFALMDKNAEQGGASSEAEAKSQGQEDWSRPQERTEQKSTSEQDREVYAMLQKFSVQNAWRAGLLAASGVVGLVSALRG